MHWHIYAMSLGAYSCVVVFVCLSVTDHLRASTLLRRLCHA